MANLAVLQTISGAKLNAAMVNLAVAEVSAKAQAEETSRLMKELGRSLDARLQIGNITFDSITLNGEGSG